MSRLLADWSLPRTEGTLTRERALPFNIQKRRKLHKAPFYSTIIGLHSIPVLPKDSSVNSFRKTSLKCSPHSNPQAGSSTSPPSSPRMVDMPLLLLLTTMCPNYPSIRLSLLLVSVPREGLEYDLHTPVPQGLPQYTAHSRNKSTGRLI